MSPGIPRRAGQRATEEGLIRKNGVCSFAENPARASPDARIVWDACIDPGTLRITALPGDPDHHDRFDPDRFARWLDIVVDLEGREHAVLTDGHRRIRIDVEQGSLAGGPVLLRYIVKGTLGRDTEAQILPLRRLAGLLQTGRFLPALFPRERRVERMIEVLRVADALSAGVSQRDIAEGLFGRERVSSDWRIVSDSLRSRVRRLVREARRMAAGGYGNLMRRDRII